MLHGVISFQDEAMPIWGLSQSSSVSPTARSIDRAGGLLDPVGDVAGAGLEVERSAVVGHAGHGSNGGAAQPWGVQELESPQTSLR